MFSKLQEWWGYLLAKRSELKELDAKDAVMAKVILRIHRTRTHKELLCVSLHSIRPLHRLDRENSMAATQQRVEVLRAHRAEVLAAPRLERRRLDTYLPSVSGIKVVQDATGNYIAYEGNGRLAALHEVFRSEDSIELEVEQYHFKNPAKVLKGLNRVRRMNGFVG